MNRMNRTRRLMMHAAAVTLAFGLTACGMPGTTSTDSAQPADQFFQERGAAGSAAPVAGTNGGSAPVAGASGGSAPAPGTSFPAGSPFPTPDGNTTTQTQSFPAPGGATGDPANMPMIGTVDAVEGNSIKLKNPDGSRLTIQVDSATKLSKDVEGQLSDIQVGASVTAFGQKNGDVVQADQVQIGSGNLPIGPMMGNDPGSVPGGLSGPSNGGGVPTMGQPVMGTVEQIQGNRITVKGFDGSTNTVELAASGKVYKEGSAEIGDFKSGTTVVAIGTRSGDSVQASQVKLMSQPSQ